MTDKPEVINPAIATPMREQGLLHIIKPETAIDEAATEQLATAMTEIIASGALDPLAKEDTRFHELSYSRLGSFGERGLAQMILEELEARGLARESEDGVSIPMHPMVSRDEDVVVFDCGIGQKYPPPAGLPRPPVVDPADYELESLVR